MTQPWIEPRSPGPLGMCVCVCVCVTVVEGFPKAPFSIGVGVGEGATPFPEFNHFTLDPYLIILSVKQGGIKYHLLSL